MRYAAYSWIVILLLFPQARPAELTIQVPVEPIEPGDYAQIFVEGIAEAELPTAVALHWPREKTIFVPARTWGGRPFIWFGSKLPGKYLVFVTVIQGSELSYAEGVVTVVEGENPQPDPIPPPIPGERSIVVIYESATRTGREAAVMHGLQNWLEKSDHRWRIVDKDLREGATGKTPAWLIPYLEAVTHIPLPALIVAAVSNGRHSSIVGAEKLPATVEEAINVIKKYGG